jgi:hypothetical protein
VLKCPHSGCGGAVVRCSGMFALLRYNGKANGEEPKRQKERTLKHGRIQNQIAANASEICATTRDLVEQSNRSTIETKGAFLVILSEAKNL